MSSNYIKWCTSCYIFGMKISISNGLIDACTTRCKMNWWLMVNCIWGKNIGLFHLNNHPALYCLSPFFSFYVFLQILCSWTLCNIATWKLPLLLVSIRALCLIVFLIEKILICFDIGMNKKKLLNLGHPWICIQFAL